MSVHLLMSAGRGPQECAWALAQPALRLLRRRLAEADTVAGRELVTERRRIHDDLVRGDPARVERPSG